MVVQITTQTQEFLKGLLSRISMQCMQNATFLSESTRLSVCLSIAGVVSKRMYISSHLFDDLIRTSF